MTNEPSQSPLRVEKAADECRFWIVRNPDGVSIGMTWREADAALIVDAVNFYDRTVDKQLVALLDERDLLRDIVRRLLPLAETAVENLRALGTSRFPFLEHIKSDRLRGDINREVSNADHLLREARAAIGEDKHEHP